MRSVVIHKSLGLLILLYLNFTATKSALAQPITEIPKLPTPFLVTPAGQTPDTLMVSLIGERAKLDMRFERFAHPKELQGVKSIVLVIGVVVEGVGSASDQQFQDPSGGLSLGEEIARVELLIKAAASKRIKTVGMHIGGSDRRDEMSDSVIHRIAPKVDYLVVVKEGDRDGMFRKIAEDNKVLLIYMKGIVELESLLSAMFSPASK